MASQVTDRLIRLAYLSEQKQLHNQTASHKAHCLLGSPDKAANERPQTHSTTPILFTAYVGAVAILAYGPYGKAERHLTSHG